MAIFDPQRTSPVEHYAGDIDPAVNDLNPSLDDLDPTLRGRRHAAEESARRPFSAVSWQSRHSSRLFRILGVSVLAILVLSVASYLCGRHWIRAAAYKSLPQIDGSVIVPGLSAPVTIRRDAHGIPHIRAASLDDLVFAQDYATAQDRLWQMETLRRHAAGTLAEILGNGFVPHDRTQRILQLRAAADNAIDILPSNQLHWLEIYARGVNASMDVQRAHLPIEFRLIGSSPAPWIPRNSLLVGLAIDHAGLPSGSRQKRLHQAADLLRDWNERVDANAAALAIVDAARSALWPLVLAPKLGDAKTLYSWSEKSCAEEQLIVHASARWLPFGYPSWNELLADAVDKGLHASHAPGDLSMLSYGKLHPVDIEHPLFASTPLLQGLLGLPTGTGPLPQSGDSSTVKQVGKIFGSSERFTADLANLDHSTLNLMLDQSEKPATSWFLDQFQAWYTGKTFVLPFSAAAVHSATTHTLTLMPQ